MQVFTVKKVTKGVFIMVLLAALTGFTGCGKEKIESKNMEQIHADQGVPVRTVQIAPRDFQRRLSFHAVLKGLKESSAGAPMDGRIDKLYVKVGDKVKKDQVIAAFPSDSPATQYFQAKAAYENAVTAFKRIEGLYKAGGISRQDRDNAATQLKVAKANWDTMRQLIKIKAPISGVVTKVHVSETDGVEEKSPLVTIARTDRLKAEIWVSESEISEIQKGQTVEAVWRGERAAGTVTQVDMAMNLYKRAFRALVEFDNAANILKAGTTVDIYVTVASKPGVIVVERKDIIKRKDGNYVFVVNNGKAQKRPVTMGQNQGLDVEILQGLKPGDQMVIEGQLLLDDGVKVRIVK